MVCKTTTQGCPPSIVRNQTPQFKNCDECPVKVEIDCTFWQHRYSPVIQSAVGVGRDISTFLTPATAAANFLGFTTEEVLHDMPGPRHAMVHRVWEQVISLPATPTVVVDETNYLDLANPIYVVPWLDPATSTLSNEVFDTSLSATNSIGKVIKLCGQQQNMEARVTCPADPTAASDTTTFTPTANPCGYSKVWVRFTSTFFNP